MGRFYFPQGFFWGAATSAHQVEGGNRNDWIEWEKSPARIEALKKEGKNPEDYISGRACDHYNRFREDFDITKALGHNAHRFSIEWSRIEPEEGKFNEKEIEHYRGVIQALRERGIEPFVTLWHWTLPVWVRQQGGWENKKTFTDFLRYVRKVVSELGEVRYWIPINEPSVYVGYGYILGIATPGVRSYLRGNRVLKNLIHAHKKSYSLIHELIPDAKVGSAHHVHYHLPATNSLLDRMSVAIVDYLRDARPLRASGEFSDFIGLNYYYRQLVQFSFRENTFALFKLKNSPNAITSDMGWDIAPEGIYHVLKKVSDWKLPIYITENGLADSQDSRRTEFIREHIRWIGKAIQDGVDLKGYLHWSLLDNFEWHHGFWPRFGLVEVDYKTMERKVRPSAWEYKKIIEANAVDLDD